MSDLPEFHDDARPLIVTGAPRSGTTFLTVAMNQHPQILLTNELRPWTFINHVRLRSKQPSELLPEHPLRDRFQGLLMGNLYRFVDRFYRTKIPRSELFAGNTEKASVPPVIRAYGDKNPSYADPKEVWCAEMIAKHWPGVRFVHIHRDPRSCAASYKAVKVYSDQIERGTNIWTRHLTTMTKLSEKLGPERIMHIRYEDLVTEAGLDIFRKLEDFLELDHAKEPIRFLEREMKSRTPYRAPTTPGDLLGQTSFDQRLTPQDIGYVEYACRELMEEFGYAPTMTREEASQHAAAVRQLARAAATKAKEGQPRKPASAGASKGTADAR